MILVKIVSIFAHRLFAFHYEGEADNEYDRLLDLWTDTEYVRSFLNANDEDIPKGKTKRQFVNYIREDAINIDEQLIRITETTDESLSHFFQPLYNNEYQFKILSLQKGRQHCLRLYAIKIDEDTFIITGGAIKLPLHHLMEDREHTRLEMSKLEKAKRYLEQNKVFDDDSFYEFLKEN